MNSNTDCFNDVLVFERLDDGTEYRVPEFRREVRRSSGRHRSRAVQSCSPDCPLVTLERTDPVTGVALTQHGFAICRRGGVREVILFPLSSKRETELYEYYNFIGRGAILNLYYLMFPRVIVYGI